MRDFFDEHGRTKLLAFGVQEVRWMLKAAENTAHRKNSHFKKENYQPPMRCRCKWNITCPPPFSTLYKSLYPDLATPCALAISLATITSSDRISWSASIRSLTLRICFLGTNNRWTGACGLISLNTTSVSVWNKMDMSLRHEEQYPNRLLAGPLPDCY